MRLSNMWSSPMYHSVGEIRNALPQLETARFGKVSVDGIEQPDQLAVKSESTGKAYCYPSKRYAIVQNADVVRPFLDTIESLGLDVAGSVYQQDGNMTTIIRLRDNAQKHRSLVVGEDIGTMIRFKNSYTSESGFGANLDFERVKCTNGMIGVLPGYSWSMKHFFDMEDARFQWENFIHKIEGAPARLASKIATAKSVEVNQPESWLALVGAGYSFRVSARIANNLNLLYPESKVEGVTAWALNNGATNYYSHEPNGLASMDSTISYLGMANKFLTDEKEIGRLVEQGLKSVDEYAQSHFKTPKQTFRALFEGARQTLSPPPRMGEKIELEPHFEIVNRL